MTLHQTEYILQKLKENLSFLPPQEEINYDPTFIHVETKVDRGELIKRGEKTLSYAEKHNYILTPSNATSLQQYAPDYGCFMLKCKQIKLVESQELYKWIFHTLPIIVNLLKEESFTTKRALFYSNQELFNYNQGNSDLAVDYVAIMLGCSRDVLPVHANYRGVVVGNLQFRYDGCDIDCTTTDKLGHHIPLIVNEVTNITPTEALFILVVESISILANLHAAKFEERFSCIIVSGSGIPCMCTRKFVRKISINLRLPVLALVDGDIYGFEILTIYGKGSKQMAYNGESLIIPNILWLGVRPSDRKNYEIPEKCMKSLSEEELKYLGTLLKKPHVRENDGWVKELNIMLKTKQKIDIHATNVKWLVETYLPTKLKSLDWLK